jgi:alkylation response protein AidB-like acyl-CoA dehydrogenase
MLVLCFVVAGSEEMATGGRPVTRFGVIPAAEVRVIPTWNDAAGMRGSGSHDVVVDGVYVPAEATLMPFFEPPTANGALYRMPFFTIIRSLIVGVPLGAARRALDELTALCQNKIRDSAPLVEDQDVQIRLAEAEAALRAGRSNVLEMTQRSWAAALEGQEDSRALRTEYTLAAQFAMRSAVRAVDLAFEIAGVSAALTGDVIQRCWRDVNVASQHATFSRNRWRGAGKALLGLETDPLYL